MAFQNPLEPPPWVEDGEITPDLESRRILGQSQYSYCCRASECGLVCLVLDLSPTLYMKCFIITRELWESALERELGDIP